MDIFSPKDFSYNSFNLDLAESKQLNKIIFCLMGPTASGKTQLAVELSGIFPFEIISVDSAMIYRGMNIGTSKPSPSLLDRVPHRLIDIRDPAESYSAAQFCKDAISEIEDIFKNGRFPLLVGGTMLYYRALQTGISPLPSANSELRNQLTAEANALGWTALHARLEEIDPMAAHRIHPNDSQRIQRALEVYLLTGQRISEQQNRLCSSITSDDSYRFFSLGLIPQDRQKLHKRISSRFQLMLSEGFVEEVSQLFMRKDLNLDYPSIRSVGYRQIWEFLEGKCSYHEMVEKAEAATRQLAKRQLTWLKSWKNLIAFNSEADDIKFHVVTTIKLILEGIY